jgi:hypothetical protein
MISAPGACPPLAVYHGHPRHTFFAANAGAPTQHGCVGMQFFFPDFYNDCDFLQLLPAFWVQAYRGKRPSRPTHKVVGPRIVHRPVALIYYLLPTERLNTRTQWDCVSCIVVPAHAHEFTLGFPIRTLIFCHPREPNNVQFNVIGVIYKISSSLSFVCQYYIPTQSEFQYGWSTIHRHINFPKYSALCNAIFSTPFCLFSWPR